MRYLVGVVALAPFVILLVAMAVGRARVRACCAPTTAARHDHVVHEPAGAAAAPHRHP